MLKVCICDDDAKDLADIQALVKRFARAHPGCSIQLQAFSSPHDLLAQTEKDGGFDLYLLDILMPQLQGVELARHIRVRSEAAEIVFLTVSPEYALEAFDVAACGYLIKPVEMEKLERVMLRAIRRLERPEEAGLLLKTKEGLQKLPLRELVMVESFNHNRVCTLADGSAVVTPDTLASIMERLSSDSRFFSPHRAYIINLEQISAINATNVVLATGQHIPVSRANLAPLKKAYMRYLF